MSAPQMVLGVEADSEELLGVEARSKDEEVLRADADPAGATMLSSCEAVWTWVPLDGTLVRIVHSMAYLSFP